MATSQFTAGSFRNFRWTASGYSNWRTGYPSTDTTNLDYVRHPYKSYIFFDVSALAGRPINSVAIRLTPGYYPADERMDATVHLWRMANCDSMPSDALGNSMADGIETTTGVNGYFVERLNAFTLDKRDPTQATVATGAAAQRLVDSLLAGNALGMFYRGQNEGTTLWKPDGWMRNGGSVAPVLIVDYQDVGQVALSHESREAGQAITATITPAVSGDEHKVVWSFGAYAQDSGMLDAETTEHELDPIPMGWLAAIPNAVSGQGKCKLETYRGGVLVGSTEKNFVLQAPASVKPTVSALQAARINGIVPSGWAEFVQGKSKAKLTADGIGGVYGSTVASVTVTGGGQATKSPTVTEGAIEQDTDFLTVSGANTFTCRVTDSRGRYKEVSAEITVRPYENPGFDAVISRRCDADGDIADNGTYILASCTTKFSGVNGKNSASAQVRYREKDAQSWSDYADITSGVPLKIGAGDLLLNKWYDVEYKVTDGLGVAASITDYISTALIFADANKTLNSLALGMAATLPDAVQISPDLDLYHGEDPYVTDVTLLPTLTTLDGPGSGLDADTVDGLEGEQIAKINHGYAKDGGTTKDITFSKAGYYLIAVTHNKTAATRGLYIANVGDSGVNAAYALVSGANLTVSVPSTWVVRIASSSGTPEVWPVRIS